MSEEKKLTEEETAEVNGGTVIEKPALGVECLATPQIAHYAPVQMLGVDINSQGNTADTQARCLDDGNHAKITCG